MRFSTMLPWSSILRDQQRGGGSSGQADVVNRRKGVELERLRDGAMLRRLGNFLVLLNRLLTAVTRLPSAAPTARRAAAPAAVSQTPRLSGFHRLRASPPLAIVSEIALVPSTLIRASILRPR